jgi:hypothetical protein
LNAVCLKSLATDRLNNSVTKNYLVYLVTEEMQGNIQVDFYPLKRKLKLIILPNSAQNVQQVESRKSYSNSLSQ